MAAGYNKTDDLVSKLERFFTDLVTQTPMVIAFTAYQAAGYLGMKDTKDVSTWLQRYRDVQGNKTLSRAAFTIATFNRGPSAEWYILTWPGATASERDTSGEINTMQCIMTVVREEVRPMLRNIEVEFSPAVLKIRRPNRALVVVNETKLNGYRTIVLNLQRDVLSLSRVRMVRAAKRLDKVLDATVTEIDLWRSYMATL